MEDEQGPYARAWRAYWDAGWRGVLPLPAGAKSPPPGGFTGWAGVDPSRADIQAWLDEGRGAGNIGLHLPTGVYGLDVDAYAAKRGAESLAALVGRFGPLPATWVLTSRSDGRSGIRFFRADLPPGRVWIDQPAGTGAGIEAIHKGHRYAVAWPSVHPDTGATYMWWPQDGVAGFGPDEVVPRIEDLPELPAGWIEGLSRPGEVREGTSAGHDEAVAIVNGWRVGEACPALAEALQRALGGLAAAVAGDALHPTANGSLWELARLGHEGHAGARRALAEHYSAFLDAAMRHGRTQDVAHGEWWRMVRGAVGKLDPATAREHCDCDLRQGIGVTFTPDDLGVPAAGSVGEPASSSDTAPAPSMAALLRARMLTPDQIVARAAPAPLVAGLLYRDSLAWLIGRSGSFKSFIALDVAAHVAEGKVWAGRRVWGGPVVYVAAEGAGGMSLRVRAWTEKNGPMSDDLLMLPEAIQATGEHWPTLIEVCREVAPALIVIDTQARVSVGVKENDNTEMGAFIARLDMLRRATRACVWTVHHIGRQGNDARGASAIDGAQDTELRVERVGGSKSLRASLSVDKQKDAPDTAAVALDLAVVDLGADMDTGEPLTSLVVAPDLIGDPFPVAPWTEGLNENQSTILSILREQFSERGGTRADVRGHLKERGQRGGQRYVKSTFDYAWNALLKKDLILAIPGSERFVINDELTQAKG